MPFIAIVLHNIARRKARSILTCLGIALAVGTAVSLVSFATGLEQSSVEVYGNQAVDIVVLRAGVTERLTSNLNAGIGDRLAALPGVAAVNSSLTDMVSMGEGSLIGMPVHGWPAEAFAMQSLRITSGRRPTGAERGLVLLGEGLAETLRKKIGDTVEIENRKFQVAGIFEGINLFENTTAVVPLADLQELMERPGQVTEFQIHLNDSASAKGAALESLCKKINALTSPDGKRLGLAAIPTQEYITGSSEIALAHALADVTSLIALVIGSLGMLNTMAMSVFERTQEIGTLRAIGWRKSRVLRMILGESLVLSFAGAIIGLALAGVLNAALARAPAILGLVRPELPPRVFWQALGLAIMVGVVGGLYPAYRGAGLLPTEALRYE